MILKDFLKEQKLSISKFCKETGLNEATVTKWKFCGVIPKKPQMLID